LNIFILKYYLLFFNVFCILSFSAQNNIPKVSEFIAPLDVPLYLAGNFGELRSNHFHAGLDIKTGGREGLKIYSIADGYVSRIKVSPYGYGKAIYIRHPNGYTSVYGHLKKFREDIEIAIKKHQYANKSFKVEMYPSAGQFPLKQGDLIAISGNSGGSVAPHLHFEIRETRSEKPVNPLKFGFDIKDNIKPSITELQIYPIGPESEINGKNGVAKFSIVIDKMGIFRISGYPTIPVYGKFGFGIKAYDKLNEVPNRCGIYEMEIYQNERLIYHHKMDKISFSETRYLNAFVDYREKIKNNTWVHRNYILPNNKLNVYQLNESGITSILIGHTQNFKYVIRDTYGNESILKFEMIGVEKMNLSESILSQKPTKHFKCKEANTFESGHVLVYLPANVLYEDLNFNYWISDTIKNAISPTYNIHDLYTPLHSYMALSIKMQNIDAKLKRYCVIVSQDENKKIIPEGGYWKGNYLIVKTRSFGAYTVMVDSVKPKLTPVNIPSNKDMSRKWSLIIKAEDNLSGVHKYNGYIDGEWVLMEYDYKKKRLIHRFEDDLTKGGHSFRLVVIDKIGNASKLEFDFTR